MASERDRRPERCAARGSERGAVALAGSSGPSLSRLALGALWLSGAGPSSPVRGGRSPCGRPSFAPAAYGSLDGQSPHCLSLRFSWRRACVAPSFVPRNALAWRRLASRPSCDPWFVQPCVWPSRYPFGGGLHLCCQDLRDGPARSVIPACIAGATRSVWCTRQKLYHATNRAIAGSRGPKRCLVGHTAVME